MNWYKNITSQNYFSRLSEPTNSFDSKTYISNKLNELGINKDNYDELSDSPIELKRDLNHPNYEFIGWGSQNSVVKNKQTGKIEKYPSGGKYTPSTSHVGGKTYKSTKFDTLVNNIEKAIHLNVSRKLLNLISLNTRVDRKGIIHEDSINTNKTTRWNQIKGINSPIFYLDALRTDGQGNVFDTENGMVIVDGIHIIPSNASSKEEKEHLEELLKKEIDRIVSELV